MPEDPSAASPKVAGSPTILYFVSEDWYFCSHRLSLARAAKEAGYRVVVVTRVRQHADSIRVAGLKLVPIELSRGRMNPLFDLRVIRDLIRIYKLEKPDIVHHVGMKPILYGSLAARVAAVPAVVNAFAGLGYLYVATKPHARFARALTESLLRRILKRCLTRTIAQNPDDRRRLIQAGLCAPQTAVLIRGAGVDTALFAPRPEPQGEPLVILASRMLWTKGVGDFVNVVQRLRAAGVLARFALVGASDPGNPAAVPDTRLREWHDAGVIEWWGQRADMAEVFAQSSIVCLPSTYGEGVPKVLIEAAASGRALVAYDTPGCREIVRHGHNGLLVSVGSISALADAVRTLLEDRALRETMGQKGRAMAVNEFDATLVIERTLSVYRELATIM